ncbi:hypothetical protein [Gordonia sp. (in: high G+C Gram-positive bacteria)]|uniref:hypothetical protein n=1 Tax=Gordonia sp. (in: high G+C Gram-positive bacteria) TaxID=84139 RepID=UPI0026230CBB|nr:hypothetical protein [Gordonia sp. (in: high G+C Gram-positive bacteria)]
MTEPTAPRPDWIGDFSIPDDASGAVLALDFGPGGIWAARLARDLTVERAIVESRITPAVLDVRIASYLRDAERVPESTDPAVFAELRDICRRARPMLVARDSALLMGTDRLRLVTVDLDTVMWATVPEVNRAHGMIVELAGDDPVAAVFLGPGTDEWPGLWEALTERGYAMLLPEDEFPETFAGDEESTAVFEAVDSGAPTALAWGAAPDEDGEPAAPARRRSVRRNRVIVTVAAVALVAAVGAGVAVATMSNHDSGPHAPVTEAAASASGTPTTTEDDTPTTAEPADIRAARAEMKRYTPPPTTTSKSSTATVAPTGPKPRPRPRPDNRRTIPNPIPGLPPIVIG